MAILATQTIVGRVVSIYELRTVGKDNIEVIDFRVAVTPRKRVDGEWTDGETYWVNVTAWGRLAKNISESFEPGHRVIIHGHTEMKPGYTNKKGVEVEPKPFITADFAGLELSYDSAVSNRKPKGSDSHNEEDKPKSSPSKDKESKVTEETSADDDDLFSEDDEDEEFLPF